MASATSSRRDQTTTERPASAHSFANAVPHEPAPITATRRISGMPMPQPSVPADSADSAVSAESALPLPGYHNGGGGPPPISATISPRTTLMPFGFSATAAGFSTAHAPPLKHGPRSAA